MLSCSDEQPQLVKTDKANQSANQNNHYIEKIQPLLDKRCVVCHGCYDAPCQLKLSSAEGLIRGGNKSKVYNGTRLLADPLTRLYIDAENEAEWREKNFFPVLAANEKDQTKSLFARFLQLKAKHPLPVKPNEILPSSEFDFALSRKQSCSTADSFNEFSSENPMAGMPYGLPKLAPAEYAQLQAWLEAGAQTQTKRVALEPFKESLSSWEAFLNGDSKKEQLVGRYIYEHLFLANIYFESQELTSGETPQYFKLVRSLTPPGKPIELIATRRPFDDPVTDPNIEQAVDRVYYRLQPVINSIVVKNHIPYRLGESRLARWNDLFFKTNYSVDALPDYLPENAANPFKTFGQIPESARYRFMLEHSKFTIRGFMKGAVCRGQVALNVINDHFWVVFVEPEQPLFETLYREIPNHIEELNLPAELESNAGLTAHWTKYSDQQAKYLKLKSELFENAKTHNQPDVDWVWDGDKSNYNAALTIYRHFDSASVVQGMVGNTPKTIWLIDYPILERIHYLLVAGFDVYGNAGHQLATRMYMDFLRMESEFNFLTLLPIKERKKVKSHWYRDAKESTTDYVYGKYAHLNVQPKITYPEDKSAKAHLIELIKERLGPVLAKKHWLSSSNEIEKQLLALQTKKPKSSKLMPEMGLLMLTEQQEIADVYTLFRTSAHTNITSLFREQNNRIAEEDYLTIMPGVVGSYPDALWVVEKKQLPDFLRDVHELVNESDYQLLMKKYGVRRSHPKFWQYSDQLHTYFKQHSPIEYGILDYMRLENR